MANTTDTVTLAGLKAEKDYKKQTLDQVEKRIPVENEILDIQQRQAITANTYSKINILMQRGFEISNLQDDITKDRLQSELDLFQQ